VRLGIIHNVDVDELERRSAVGHLCLARAVDVALDMLDVGVTKVFVTKLVKEENVEALRTGDKTWEDLSVSVRHFSLSLCHLSFYKILLIKNSRNCSHIATSEVGILMVHLFAVWF